MDRNMVTKEEKPKGQGNLYAAVIGFQLPGA
jgi:hypothetical protein